MIHPPATTSNNNRGSIESPSLLTSTNNTTVQSNTENSSPTLVGVSARRIEDRGHGDVHRDTSNEHKHTLTV